MGWMRPRSDSGYPDQMESLNFNQPERRRESREAEKSNSAIVTEALETFNEEVDFLGGPENITKEAYERTVGRFLERIKGVPHEDMEPEQQEAVSAITQPYKKKH